MGKLYDQLSCAKQKMEPEMEGGEERIDIYSLYSDMQYIRAGYLARSHRSGNRDFLRGGDDGTSAF